MGTNNKVDREKRIYLKVLNTDTRDNKNSSYTNANILVRLCHCKTEEKENRIHKKKMCS